MAQRPSYAAMAHRESFKHENLKLSENSIRLFQVQPGSKADPISLRITQYAIQKRPPYKAISYTWGSAINSQPILVNGRSFSIHPNLWHLLFHLRQRKELSFLWADRMCIDQDNLAERNFHVQLMGKIYDQAKSVIVWLGLPSADRTEIRAVDFIKDMTAFRNSHSEAAFADTFLAPEADHRWETLLRMCNHHYWSRTWIIQEFIRATELELVCGRSSLGWAEFESLLDFLDGTKYRCKPVIARILKSRPVRLTLRRRAEDSTTLLELLREYHDSSCTERRDKIYGILGLASDCGEDDDGQPCGVIPDYKKHVVQVYLDAVACISATIASRAQIPAAANLAYQALSITSDDIANYIEALSPAVDELPLLDIVPEYVGTIQHVLPTWTNASDLRQKLSLLDWGEFVGYEMKSTRPGVGRRSSARAVHSVLPDDLVQNMVNAADYEPQLALLHNLPSAGNLHIPPQHLLLSGDEKRYFQNDNLRKPLCVLEQPVSQRSMRLGFACTNARRGDLLLQFRGLNVAVVVRRLGVDLEMIGKAVVIKHSAIEHGELDVVAEDSPWYSPCPSAIECEMLNLQSDAISLSELLMRH